MQCHRASPWLSQAAATPFPLGHHLPPCCGETTWPNGAGWSCGHGSANPRCGSPRLFGKWHPCTTWQAWFDSNHSVDMLKNILKTKANKHSRDMDSKNGKLCKLCGRNSWIEKYIWYRHQIQSYSASGDQKWFAAKLPFMELLALAPPLAVVIAKPYLGFELPALWSTGATWQLWFHVLHHLVNGLPVTQLVLGYKPYHFGPPATGKLGCGLGLRCCCLLCLGFGFASFGCGSTGRAGIDSGRSSGSISGSSGGHGSVWCRAGIAGIGSTGGQGSIWVMAGTGRSGANGCTWVTAASGSIGASFSGC